jgi:predicted nucleic acid-binding protein
MIVVDASVALKWIIPEPDSDKARALQTEVLLAPAIWLSEVANVLWRNVRVSNLSEREATVRFRRLRDFGVRLTPIEEDIERALALSIEVDHPVYDCLYLALAIREGATVVTADERFVSAARRHKKWSDYVERLADR